MTDQFSVNFGNAKEPEPLELPDEGNYTLIIQTYQAKQAKNPESRLKGFNIELKFSIDDPEVDPRVNVWHNLWVQNGNPFAAKYFFEKLTGKDLETEELDLGDADNYVGSSIGATLVHEYYTGNDGKEKKKL